MGRPDTITMSMRELDRCKVIQAIVDDGLMVCVARRSWEFPSGRLSAWCCAIDKTVHAASYHADGVNPDITSCRLDWSHACAA